MPKITKKLVEQTKPLTKDIIIRDSEIKGFICKITPKGRKVYMLYYRTKEGRERKPSIGVHGNITCEFAKETAKEWLSSISKGKDPSLDKKIGRNAPTIKELGYYYLEQRKPYLKQSSYIELKRLWEKNIISEIGNMKASQITKDDILKYHKQNHYRSYTANRILEAIRSAFNLAIKDKFLKDNNNPCVGVDKYKEKKRERFLNINEIQNLSNVLTECEQTATEQPNVIALIRLLLFTGCRLGEILTLKHEYIDWDNKCLRLPDSKTGAKTVYISAPALQVLSSIDKQLDNPYVIYSLKENTHIAPPQKAWRRIRKKAGLEDVRLHDLRHSFASIGAANGLSLPIIGALLGHKNSTTTARYAHLVGDPLVEAANLIGSKIDGAMKNNVNSNNISFLKSNDKLQ